MEEKAIELIENLANQLGVAVPYLWEVLVNQAHVAAVTSILFLAAVFVVVSVLLFLFTKSLKEDWDVGGPIILCLLVVFGIVFIIQIFEFAYTVPTAFLNPEYWALKQIMNMI